MNFKHIIFIFSLFITKLIFANTLTLVGASQDQTKELEENFELSEEVNADDISSLPQINIMEAPSTPLKTQLNKNTSVKMADFVALNKVTSKSEKFSVKIGESTFFGNIEIRLIKCYKSSDIYNPIDKILLRVDEHKIDSDPDTIFQGWLFSSNPSISGVKHPVYEIIAIRCYSE